MLNILRAYQTLLKRILFTVFVVLVYTAIYNIQYPYVHGTEYSYTNVDSYWYNINYSSILSISTRPYMIANIIFNMVGLIFPYFKELKRNNPQSRLGDISVLFLMCLISITQSVVASKHIERYVDSHLVRDFFISYCVINLMCALFVAWFNRQMVLNGVGHGVSIILSLQMINNILASNKIYDIKSLFSFFDRKEVMFLFVVFFICVFIEKIKMKLPILALSNYKKYQSSEFAISEMEYKVTNSSIMANILATQSINIAKVLFDFFTNNLQDGFFSALLGVGFINKKFFSLQSGTMKYKYIFVCISYGILLFLFSYAYNIIYYKENNKSIEVMRKNICYIPDVRLSKYESTIDRIIVVCSMLSVLTTVFIIALPMLLNRILGHSLKIGGLDMIIIVGSFTYIIDFSLALIRYKMYRFDIDGLASYKEDKEPEGSKNLERSSVVSL